MFYHIRIEIVGVSMFLLNNLTKYNVLNEIICPFINKEITYLFGKIYNIQSFSNLRIFVTKQPIDSEWPISKGAYKNDDPFGKMNYDQAISEYLQKNDFDISQSIFEEAIVSIRNGEYQNFQDALICSYNSKTAFMICPFGNQDVDRNYEYIIKPAVEKHGLQLERVDLISHTGYIPEKILDCIRSSLFVIVDLTDEKHNCYYELGYAHALGKKAILLAKKGTPRYFDISTYKWNYWESFEHLKPLLEVEINSILEELKYK